MTARSLWIVIGTVVVLLLVGWAISASFAPRRPVNTTPSEIPPVDRPVPAPGVPTAPPTTKPPPQQ